MPNPINLEPGKYYHIFNRGVNGTDLFYRSTNYYHFLRLYDKYMNPTVETFAWCLLKNHFHLLVRIKKAEEIETHRLPIPLKVLNIKTYKPHLKTPYRYFSDLFNSYSQAINKQQKRTGPLFERPFHRLEVSSEEYFRQLIIYIHTNPVKHKFTQDYKGYAWSSYGSVFSLKKTRLNREQVLGWFNDKAEFIRKHEEGFKPEVISVFRDEYFF